MNIRKQCSKVYHMLAGNGTTTLTKIAEILNISKSSARRRKVVVESRSHHPCASIFETEVGFTWLRLLIVSTIFFLA